MTAAAAVAAGVGARGRPPVRVSLREIRETAYRALVAHGACPGRAPAAAELVLEAELHDRAGLAALLADLARGPWDPGGLVLCERTLDGRAVVEVTSPDAGSVLRVGHVVADLAAAVGAVHVPALHAPWPLLAPPLLAAAGANGCSLAVFWAGGSASATPEGALATTGFPGTLPAVDDPSGRAALPGTLLLAVDDPPGRGAGLPGALLAVDDPQGRGAAGEATPPRALRAPEDAPGPGAVPAGGHPAGPGASAAARERRRRSAARDGVLVDAGLFDRAYAAARAFLVPESDRPNK